ncbi:hypothetical protein E5S67_04989 [Microcoleus sp. IPMA8]|uniref:Uncharacterized protein n=1 Tax=Microcoleus asticus IPMA8 TaxID=2563858 RepID=A0ABX2D6J0_9CYAN|nr:hypothetical protein [Microcoleus asticus IPMA8]
MEIHRFLLGSLTANIMSGKPCQGFEKAIKVRSKTELLKLSVIVTNTNINIPIWSGKSLQTSKMKLPSLATW